MSSRLEQRVKKCPVPAQTEGLSSEQLVFKTEALGSNHLHDNHMISLLWTTEKQEGEGCIFLTPPGEKLVPLEQEDSGTLAGT